jgi:hypothetical protein
MTAQPNVQGLSVSYDAYIRHGWSLVPIPPSSKGPNFKGWNKKENCLQLGTQLPPDFGVGLAHAYSGTMALDIDDLESARHLLGQHNIFVDLLLSAPDAVTIESGNPGHHKLIYTMPFGATLASKKIRHEGKTAYELRCATADGLTVQDVLPPSRHPRGTTYQWGGNGNWQRLPTIPDALLTLWQSLIEADQAKTIRNEGASNTSLDEVTSALHAIDPSCDRQTWIECGMALHSTGHSEGFDLWNDWSSASPKYNAREMTSQWNSFKDRQDGITIGTLFHHAQEAGWKRPAPDVAHLFSAVQPTKSADVTEGLIIPPPVLDIAACVPDVLAKRANEVSIGMAADPLVPIFAGLAAAAAAADARIRLNLMGEWKVPPVLWLMTIGSPSTKKTPAAKPMLEPLIALEKEDAPRYQDELTRFEALDMAYATSKKAYLEAAKDASFMLSGQNTQELPVVAPKPDKPVPLRFIVSDITSQKLVRMVADRPRGMLAYLDETKTWADRMTDRTSPENRGTWVKAYNAERETLDRVGDGKAADNSVVMDNFAVSIYANIQPRVIRSHIDGLTADGLLQRFAFCLLRDEYSERKNDPYHEQATRQQWEMVIRRIYAMPVTEYQLSPEAFDIYRSWQDWYISLKQDERLVQASEGYMDGLGKIDGLCGRIMLVYHLIADPYNPFISGATAAMACHMVKTYLIPSMRYVLGDIGGMASGSVDKWITQHIMYLSGEAQFVTLSNLKRSAKRKIENMQPHHADQAIIDAMAMLETHGWVAITQHDRKTMQWAINPRLAAIDREGKQKAIDAKQRIYDHIHETSGGVAPRRIVTGYVD